MKKRWMHMLLISLLLFSLAIGGCMEAAPDENGREEAPEAPRKGCRQMTRKQTEKMKP